MRHSLLLIPAAVVGLVTAAVVFPAFADTKSYNLSNFDKLNVSAGIRVDVVQGPFSVKVDTPNNNFDNLVIEVRGSTLRLGRKNTGWFTKGPEYRVTVSAPSYSGFDVSSGAHVESDTLTMKDVSVDVSSGAHVEIEGSCGELKLDVSSGAHFNGEDLKCQSASVDASSGAHADAFASQTARGNASSGAHISFHGKPTSVDRDTSSGGSVKSL